MKRQFLYCLYLFNIALIVCFWFLSSRVWFSFGFGTSLIAIARLAGLLGAYLVLTQFILISRAAWLEGAFGFDRLTRMHRKNGIAAFALISTHIPLMISGTAKLNQVPPPEQTRILLSTYPYVWLAALAYLALVVTIMLSIAAARKYLKYETWYAIHFLNYAVVILAFFHQVANGNTLLQNDGFRYYWFALHLTAFINLLFFRFAKPLLLHVKHRFTVARIEREADGIYSIYVTGRNLEAFRYQAGQFAKWRFLTQGLWQEEHPFSLSIEPRNTALRITAKAVGDYTGKLPKLQPDTPVIVSGPLGTFTLQSALRDKLLFVAGGIGITPLRAMLGAPEAQHKDIVLLYAAKKPGDIAFGSELEALSAKTNIRLIYIFSDEAQPNHPHGRLDQEMLMKLVSDAAEREAFVCGPPAMIEGVIRSLRNMGLDKKYIHAERFTLY